MGRTPCTYRECGARTRPGPPPVRVMKPVEAEIAAPRREQTGGT